ncbi:MAG: alginate export family protein, partial [Ignavibacteria bacterium]|nr:alginate export family protein [Ignavibacteria bacterium]
SLSKSVPDKDDRWLTGLYLKYAPSEMSNLSVYIISDRDGTKKTASAGSKKDSLSRVTTGIYGKYNHNDLTLLSEAAYQFGSITGNRIRAYMITASVSYLFKLSALNPEMLLGADILSGDNKTNDANTRAFNTLYASNHKNYGYMDYFLDIPKHTKNLGLQDAFVKIKINPVKALKIELAYHHFTSQKKHLSYNSRFFGHETDLTMQYRFNKYFQWEQGASVFIPGTLMKRYIGGRDTGYWLYGSALFTM